MGKSNNNLTNALETPKCGCLYTYILTIPRVLFWVIWIVSYTNRESQTSMHLVFKLEEIIVTEFR